MLECSKIMHSVYGSHTDKKFHEGKKVQLIKRIPAQIHVVCKSLSSEPTVITTVTLIYPISHVSFINTTRNTSQHSLTLCHNVCCRYSIFATGLKSLDSMTWEQPEQNANHNFQVSSEILLRDATRSAVSYSRFSCLYKLAFLFRSVKNTTRTGRTVQSTTNVSPERSLKT